MQVPARLSPAVIGVLALTAACADPVAPPAATAGAGPALQRAAGAPGRPIPDEYIVVLRDDVRDVPGVARGLARAHGASVRFEYAHAIKGFAARMPAQAAAALARNPNVAYVEQDQEVSIDATQANATWGLDRIDQHDRPLSTTYTYNTTASSVHAYILDTGIRLTHGEFAGRMGEGHDAVSSGGSANDCNGHGTHVAGTVGGTTYGVAKGVTLHPVRVLGCSGSGSWSGVIAGIDWVTAHHVKPAVANMSLSGGALSSVDDAVRNSIAQGVTYALAAGNKNADACNYSPARTAEALTVGSTTSSDARSSFSNYGSCVDIFAPGSGITSAWHTGDGSTNTISGTSMASPHVAGAAALYLSANPGASPAQVATALKNAATSGVLSGIGSGSPNLLLYSLFGSGSEPEPEQPPPPSNCTKPNPKACK